MKTVPITVWIVPIILLTVAILAGIDGTRLPYGYFTFMRIIIFFAAGCIAAVGFRDGKQLWATVFVLIAVLFNPFIPIEMKKDDWLIFDIITVVVFVAHAAFGRLAAIGFIQSKNSEMHWRRGILRLWIVLTAVWISLTAWLAYQNVIVPRQIAASETVCSVAAHRCDINFNDLIPWQPEAERYIAWAILPPLGLMAFGLVAAWIVTGFVRATR